MDCYKKVLSGNALKKVKACEHSILHDFEIIDHAAKSAFIYPQCCVRIRAYTLGDITFWKQDLSNIVCGLKYLVY